MTETSDSTCCGAGFPDTSCVACGHRKGDGFFAGNVVSYHGPGYIKDGAKAVVIGYTESSGMRWLHVVWLDNLSYNAANGGFYQKDFRLVDVDCSKYRADTAPAPTATISAISVSGPDATGLVYPIRMLKHYVEVARRYGWDVTCSVTRTLTENHNL